MEGETRRRRAKRSEVGRSWGERAQSGALLSEGARSGTMINEAALGRDKEISVRRSLKVKITKVGGSLSPYSPMYRGFIVK